MNFTRRVTMGLIASAVMATGAQAQDMPAPLDNAGDVTIALVRYLSTGDFFQAYLAGVEAQSAALGVDLRVFDSRQDAALQADMVDQAIARTPTGPSPSGADELGLKVGDDVRHAKFGEGVIIDLQGTGDKTEATVHFADAGQKILLLSWAPLEKI